MLARRIHKSTKSLNKRGVQRVPLEIFTTIENKATGSTNGRLCMRDLGIISEKIFKTDRSTMAFISSKKRFENDYVVTNADW